MLLRVPYPTEPIESGAILRKEIEENKRGEEYRRQCRGALLSMQLHTSHNNNKHQQRGKINREQGWG